ncbi:MAG: N-acetylmuramoyl-L-alanine amidase [Zetaproteobacteria bacterium]|nr:N-acetylmuramoyl-L-alanine amidase [Zetaproteobacteria bacterium]
MVFSMPSAIARDAAILDVRLWTAPDHTRVVFDLNKSVQYRVFPLSNPDRIVVDLFKSDLKVDRLKLPLPDPAITKVRYGKHEPSTSRFVFVTKEALTSESFLLNPSKDKPYRLVVDFKRKLKQQPKEKDVTVTKDVRGKKTIIIAIDAGHGGEDPGAIGRNGLKEKTVTLAVAKALENAVNGRAGMRAVLTRKGDYYVSLKGRVKRARDAHADMMISIHADAVKQRYVEGASVYTLSDRGATPDKVAAALAAKENAADEVGGAGPFAMDDPLLNMILGDMAKKDSLISAEILAKQVLKDLATVGPIKYEHPKKARFVVLGALEVPSVLVEVDFISNPNREKVLNNKRHQEKLAAALLSASENYLRRQGLLDSENRRADVEVDLGHETVKMEFPCANDCQRVSLLGKPVSLLP